MTRGFMNFTLLAFIAIGIIAGCGGGGSNGDGGNPTPTPTPTADPKCGTLPPTMDDPFFADNAVTYAGVLDEEEIVAVLTNIIITEGDAFCEIVVSGTLPGFETIQLTFRAPISEDGTTCDFAGRVAEAKKPGFQAVEARVTSGSATLSDNGMVLTFSDIDIFNLLALRQETIPSFVTTCESVSPLADSLSQEDKAEALQTIYDEALKKLQIELGE